MAFKDRDELLDKVFDHWWDSDDDPSDEDRDAFDEFVSPFAKVLDELEGVTPPGRRRQRGARPASPRRQRQSDGGRKRGRREDRTRDTGAAGYGLSMFYGEKEA